MPRAFFEKTGNAIYISHLDLMRIFQRAFKRSGLPLTHTQGYNPRPSVSIALPLSLGTESRCELLDFDLVGEKVPNDEILRRLNESLIDGVRILDVYDNAAKLKHLALLESIVTLEYDDAVAEDAVLRIQELFSRSTLPLEKKGKNGIIEQDIIPMLRQLDVRRSRRNEIELRVLACCQNPTLNPMQIPAAIRKYLPDLAPDFVRCQRVEIYDCNETVFR